MRYTFNMDVLAIKGQLNQGFDSGYGLTQYDTYGANNNSPRSGNYSRRCGVTETQSGANDVSANRDVTQQHGVIAGRSDVTSGTVNDEHWRVHHDTRDISDNNINWISMDDEIVMTPGSTLSRKDKINVFKDFVSWQRKMEKEYREKQSMWFRIWNDRCVLVASYFVGVVLFIIFFHLHTLPTLPFPVVRNLADWDQDMEPFIWWGQGAVLVEAMWGYTHIRRTLFIILSSVLIGTGTTHSQTHELLRDHDPERSRRLQRCLGACAVIYHVMFGTWLGWANNVFCGYLTSNREFIIAGVISFIVGELTVTVGESYFLCRRSTETRTFRNTRLAAEIFIWAGFALVSMSMPSILIFVTRFGMLAFFIYIPERPSCMCS